MNSALIIPFPRVRERPFVLKHARRMAELSQSTAENYLQQQLSIQVATMRKRGVDAESIEQHRRALELAIRAALWRVMLTPGGAA